MEFPGLKVFKFGVNVSMCEPSKMVADFQNALWQVQQ